MREAIAPNTSNTHLENLNTKGIDQGASYKTTFQMQSLDSSLEAWDFFRALCGTKNWVYNCTWCEHIHLVSTCTCSIELEPVPARQDPPEHKGRNSFSSVAQAAGESFRGRRRTWIELTRHNSRSTLKRFTCLNVLVLWSLLVLNLTQKHIPSEKIIFKLQTITIKRDKARPSVYWVLHLIHSTRLWWTTEQSNRAEASNQ